MTQDYTHYKVKKNAEHYHPILDGHGNSNSTDPRTTGDKLRTYNVWK